LNLSSRIRFLDFDKEESDRVIVGIPIIFHVIMAWMYGGELLDTEFPDPWAYVSTGLFLVGQDNAIPVPELPVVLPIFSGILYVILGFPDFLFYLWLWNAITLSILILAVYHVTRHYYDRRSALLASLLVGLNWRIGTNGQQLLVDVPLVAFSLLDLCLLIEYKKHQDAIPALCLGIVFSIAFWTKFSFIYLFLPILLLVFVREMGRQRVGWIYFISGLVISQAFFLGVRWIRYGDPFAGIRMVAKKHIRLGFSSLYLEHFPEYLGYPAIVFAILGLVYSLRKRRFLIPSWAIYGTAVYTFLVTPPRYFQYSVHFLPAFLILAGIGLAKTCGILARFRQSVFPRSLRLLLMGVTVLLTNSHFKETSKTTYVKIWKYTIFKTRYTMRFLHQKLEIESRFIRYPQRYLNLRGSVSPEMVQNAPYAINCAYSILRVQNRVAIVWSVLVLLIFGVLILFCLMRSIVSRYSNGLSSPRKEN